MAKSFVLLLAFIVGAFLISCQKESNLKDKPEGYEEKIYAWLGKQQKGTVLSAKIELLKKHLDLSNISIEKSEEEKIVIIPIKDGYKQQKDISAETISNLILMEDKTEILEKEILCFFFQRTGN